MMSNVIVIPRYYIPQLDAFRRLFIYLPPDYFNNLAYYPVLYMHDGQNLFNTNTSYAGDWGIDATLDAIYKENKKSILVVGIENGGEARMEEYVPNKKGNLHADFIVTTLKPDIDTMFRTIADRKHTAIAGSSLGGLMALYTANEYPQEFGAIAALSPAMSFQYDSLAELKLLQDTKIYLDVGLKEDLYYMNAHDYEKQCTAIYHRLLQSGYEQTEMIYDTDGAHNEQAWRYRFGYAVRYLFSI